MRPGQLIDLVIMFGALALLLGVGQRMESPLLIHVVVAHDDVCRTYADLPNFGIKGFPERFSE
jgi:hypothetical protein